MMKSYKAWLVSSTWRRRAHVPRSGFLSAAAVALISLGSWSPAAAQQTCSVEFNEVGEHAFTVPNVDEITVDAFGASGGNVVNRPELGGLGGAALDAVLAVNPGETLTVRVGGRGEDGVGSTGEGTGPPGGFNGGGDGGDRVLTSGEAHLGGSGGGASDIRRGTDRLVIAGGGGGAAHSGEGGHGGLEGDDGTARAECSDSFGRSAGNGGLGGEGCLADGGAGETSDPDSGVGGKGGDGNDAGGGGGGGLRGGGGGGGGAPNTGFGSGGGGGSSFGPSGTTFETGANEGDGRVEIRYQCEASISVVKTGSGPDPLVEGASVDYSFEVTNTGSVPLADVTVTDPLDGLSPIDCPGDALDPGESMTCTATYAVTQADVEAGLIENTATATGEPPADTQLPPASDNGTTTVPPTQNPGIEIVKSGSGPDPLVVGETVEYSFEVTNTGNVMLNDVTVADPLDGLSPIDCPESSLASGASMTCTASYEVTQADVDVGQIENTATATGQPLSGGPPATDTSTTTVPPAGPVPALPPLAVLLLVALLATATLWTLRRARA